MVTKRVARAADDGYRNPLIPGVKATIEAQYLALTIVDASKRLEYPGPHPAVAEQDDRSQAVWLAFLLALVGPENSELQDKIGRGAYPCSDDSLSDFPQRYHSTISAYRDWINRVGSVDEAFVGDSSWTATRRFARMFERLSLPNFARHNRFELLVTLAAANLYELEADSLHIPTDDATSLAAKRLFNSGDRMFLERRVQALAQECQVPLAALDYAFSAWNNTELEEALSNREQTSSIGDNHQETLNRINSVFGLELNQYLSSYCAMSG